MKVLHVLATEVQPGDFLPVRALTVSGPPVRSARLLGFIEIPVRDHLGRQDQPVEVPPDTRVRVWRDHGLVSHQGPPAA